MSREKEAIHLVWLKRDLRIQDNGPLEEAANLCREGIPAVALYCFEKDYWESDKASPRQRQLVMEALARMAYQFRETCGGTIHVVQCRAADEAIADLAEQYHILKILSHQETHNLWTFQRDIRVNQLAQEKGIPIKLWLQNGVNRAWYPGNWDTWWQAWALQPCAEPPQFWKEPINAPRSAEPAAPSVGHPSESPEATLVSFLTKRCLIGNGYRAEMGSSLLADQACSRMSGHLTWGSISTKECLQTAQSMMQTVENRHHQTQIHSFLKRLAWRDNFMQQFEANFTLETHCLNPEMENARSDNPELVARFCAGETGYPYVDACMRCLNETGWITFRARALLVSFAAYALNLDWRAFGPHLARNFIDYEPGIHYCQLQMQSGTLWKSQPRIYNPLKQSVEKDPAGVFIRKWIPELTGSTTSALHLPENEARNGYPAAIIPNNNLWKRMRGNGPKQKPKPPSPQMELKLEGL